MKYRYLIFDLDDTLNNDDENRKHAFTEVLRYLEKEVTGSEISDFLRFDNRYWSDRANRTVEDIVQFDTLEEKIDYIRARRFMLYFQDMPFDTAKEINRLYLEKLKENVVPIDGAKVVVKKLYDMGYRVVVATNGPVIAIVNKLKKIGIDRFVSCTFSAEECGYMKPKKEFFDGVMRKMDFYDKEKMLIIGDDCQKDVRLRCC